MTTSPIHIVIYSHDLGLHKTNRGLFTAIAHSLPDAQHVLFDYNPIHDESKTITVKPINDQVLKLRKMINSVRADNPNSVIDLVCHGQGCVVAAMLKPRDIRKIIMLTPPDDMSQESIVKELAIAADNPIDVTARTRIARTDGSTIVIHPEYWQGLSGIKPVRLYNHLAKFTQLRIMKAKQDETFGAQVFEGLDATISAVSLNGNHYFDSEESRKQLLYILQKELTLA